MNFSPLARAIWLAAQVNSRSRALIARERGNFVGVAQQVAQQVKMRQRAPGKISKRAYRFRVLVVNYNYA